MSELYVLLFRDASSSSLQLVAENYVRQLEVVNAPNAYAPSVDVLPGSSGLCVVAQPGRLAYNFHSRVVQGAIGSDIPHMEAVAAEAWLRIEKEPNEMMFIDPSTLLQMEREARLFLDDLRGYSALNVAEIKDFSLQIWPALTRNP